MPTSPSRVLVTGGAGFIGSALVHALVGAGRSVSVIDRMPWEQADRLHSLDTARLTYHQADIRDLQRLAEIVPGHSVVHHLSSNTENRGDRAARTADFDITVGGTVTLLEALAPHPGTTVVLTSSQLVYGRAADGGTLDEDSTVPRPTSRFAAGKLAAEAFLRAYAEELDLRAAVCRLSNIIGGRMRRGIVHDFVAGLSAHPDEIKVLGDGRQDRSYLHVDDCVRALTTAADNASPECPVFNVCNLDTTTAAQVARIVGQECPTGDPAISFTGGERGWTGDVPTLRVRPTQLTARGWTPVLSSDEAVRAVARALFT